MQFDLLTGVRQLVEDARLRLFPNPATDEVIVRLPAGEEFSGSLRILDAYGREILYREALSPAPLTVSLAGRPAGRAQTAISAVKKNGYAAIASTAAQPQPQPRQPAGRLQRGEGAGDGNRRASRRSPR